MAHVVRREDDESMKRAWDLEVDGLRGKGRPKISCKDMVQKESSKIVLNEDDAWDGKKWRGGVSGPRGIVWETTCSASLLTLQNIWIELNFFIHLSLYHKFLVHWLRNNKSHVTTESYIMKKFTMTNIHYVIRSKYERGFKEYDRGSLDILMTISSCC